MFGDPLSPDHPAPARAPLRLGSLCTGYGGLDLAVRAVLGAELVFTADPDRNIAAACSPPASRACSTSATSPPWTSATTSARGRGDHDRGLSGPLGIPDIATTPAVIRPADNHPPPPPRRPPRRRPPRRRPAEKGARTGAGSTSRCSRRRRGSRGATTATPSSGGRGCSGVRRRRRWAGAGPGGCGCPPGSSSG